MSAADQIYNAVNNHRHRNTGNDGTGDTQCTRSRPRAQNPRTTSYRNASDAARGSASGRGLARTTNAAPSRWHGAGRSGTWSREHSLPRRPKQPPRFEAHCHTTPLRACCWRRPRRPTMQCWRRDDRTPGCILHRGDSFRAEAHPFPVHRSPRLET